MINIMFSPNILLAFLMNKKVIRKGPIRPIKLKFGENLTERAQNTNLQITNMEIGLSAGACALQAAELGYKTGFCKCISDPDMLVKTILGQSPKDYKIMLLLGIGNPIPDLVHNVKKTKTKTYSHIHEGKLSNTYTKKIPVISIT